MRRSCQDQSYRMKSSISSSSCCFVAGRRKTSTTIGLPTRRVTIRVRVGHRWAQSNESQRSKDWQDSVAARASVLANQGAVEGAGVDPTAQVESSARIGMKCVACGTKGTACESLLGLLDCALHSKWRIFSPTNSGRFDDFLKCFNWTSKSAHAISWSWRLQ